MKINNGSLVKAPQFTDANAFLNSDCLFQGFTCTAFHANTEVVLYISGAEKKWVKVACLEGSTYYLPCYGIATDAAGTAKPTAGDVTVFFYDFN
jgi:hypothetical protein